MTIRASDKTEEKRKNGRGLVRTICWGIVLIFIIAQILLPETGVLGMVNEGSNAVLFFGIGGSCVWSIIQKRKKDKTAVVLGIFILIVVVGIGGWISRKIAADLIAGPKTIHLTSVTTKESLGIAGIISHHYYLRGTDENWKTYQFEISADEYYELEGEGEVMVLCYPRTERILKFL